MEKSKMFNRSAIIQLAELPDIFDYDPDTGVISWKPSAKHGMAGKPAGRITTCGYRQVSLRGRSYHAHRLIWAIMTGSWPAEEIDHINRDKLDNRFVNLRQATRAQNIVTEGVRRNNTSGFKGVVWDKKKRLWRARIGIGSHRKNLGRFKRIEDAYAAYCAAAVFIHGEFACLPGPPPST